MAIIVNHEHPRYKSMSAPLGNTRLNGAYFYSKEITNNIIPLIDTDRDWVLVNVPFYAADRAIVFIHNNKNPERYEWLRNYKDLILVCGRPETCAKVKHLGRAIYLPLSIDIADVMQYKRPKTKETAFVGRPAKRRGIKLPAGVDYLENMTRPALLAAAAEYKFIYAVGRCAIECKTLGAKILPYDPRYPNPRIWRVLDNKDAAAILQKKLDAIDGKGEKCEDIF